MEASYYNYTSPWVGERMHPPVLIRFSGWSQCPPAHRYGPVKRDHYLLHYIVKGKGVYTCRGKQYTLGPGDGFIIYPYEATSYEADAQTPWEYHWVAWNGDYAQDVLNSFCFTQDNLIFHKAETDEILQKFQELYDAYEGAYNSYSLLGRFYSLMALFMAQTDKEVFALNRAVTFVHNHYRTIKSVQEIADSVFMSRSNLYRLFMHACGKAPKKYLEDFRLDQAQTLLTTTAKSVGEIAHDCGYRSVSRFSSSFKKNVGLSPMRYRALRKKTSGNLNIQA